MAQLRITEIFYSLQGESNSVGLPTVFVRLTGCPLRCGYCDTTYAFKGGAWLDMQDVMAQVAAYRPKYVTVTGGEPLAQEACLTLLTALCDAGYKVSLETSGAISIAQVDPRVVNVMDLKTPGSGEMGKNLWDNIELLKPTDQVKFVLCDESDYRWACEQVDKWGMIDRCEVLFSPALGLQDATELAEWILRDRLQVRFQIQLHKYLWGDVSGK
ncbi:MAG: 7-carboxy-7-deazaguanine synthase QueE [Sedimenticola sp.]|uniref:7-carboxy-7-deazaguanine synthase n=1 Tax=Sedimenticola thiotaurini TaxID=1543721 RepID=A0A558CVB4_9GAMM|nr:7-carboxy-7-deazaguanine synthase QueE [Sedimenticola sp.]TVT52672.1 MAG: 7-carboxy-7-deazaguanine synthase QueE [Sedimenticola thiotaurini]MCW8946764.1 7-carboxy-7-deazaguanine synthase QueE [Sedimenticola sp.]MCW8975752.1 7-carboxy-7-deazaguanine synthase QueE [Sedimenticola sp.]MCW9022320.1 7-carboxy-7-deazaguanine synthase QueE [Sedimenticola sp.]